MTTYHYCHGHDCYVAYGNTGAPATLTFNVTRNAPKPRSFQATKTKISLGRAKPASPLAKQADLTVPNRTHVVAPYFNAETGLTSAADLYRPLEVDDCSRWLEPSL